MNSRWQPNCLNYCKIFILYTKLIDVAAGHMRPKGRGLETHGLEIAAFKMLKQLTTCNFTILGVNAVACIFLESITIRSTRGPSSELRATYVLV